MERSKNKVVLVNSAFYDDRLIGGQLPSLRILTVSDVTASSKLYCYVWYPGVTSAFIARVSLFTIKWKRKNPENIDQYLHSKQFFVEYIMSCQLPTNQFAPRYVSIVLDECSASDILVPVTVPQKSNHTIDFGVCVAASYGHVDIATVVQWFELHKMLGVKEFNIYNVSVSSSMKEVLQYYTSTGDLTLHHMSPIIPKSDDWTTYMNSLPTLNHCFFTNMYRYEHVIIVDLDEFITPKGSENINYTILVHNIKQKYKLGKKWTTVVFANEYFFYDYSPDKTQPNYLPFLRQRLRKATTPFFKRVKSMSNPRMCMFVGNHECVKRFPGTKVHTVVAPEIATNHHYRHCYFPPNGTCSTLKPSILDDAMLKYGLQLDRRVRPILEDLHYFNSSNY